MVLATLFLAVAAMSMLSASALQPSNTAAVPPAQGGAPSPSPRQTFIALGPTTKAPTKPAGINRSLGEEAVPDSVGADWPPPPFPTPTTTQPLVTASPSDPVSSYYYLVTYTRWQTYYAGTPFHLRSDLEAVLSIDNPPSINVSAADGWYTVPLVVKFFFFGPAANNNTAAFRSIIRRYGLDYVASELLASSIVEFQFPASPQPTGTFGWMVAAIVVGSAAIVVAAIRCSGWVKWRPRRHRSNGDEELLLPLDRGSMLAEGVSETK